MHDLGKVILAANFDAQYEGAHSVARKQRIPLWEVEKDLFGATHGEIGAYLLGLWGMPPEVVKAAAFHHQPLRAGDTTFTAVTAVHVANALEYEGNSETDGLPVPVLDAAYLEQLGLGERVELWRNERRGPEGSKGDGAAVKPATHTVKPAAFAAPRANKSAPAESSPVASLFRGTWKWLVARFGVHLDWHGKTVTKNEPPAVR
jgi:hypothetical protein